MTTECMQNVVSIQSPLAREASNLDLLRRAVRRTMNVVQKYYIARREQRISRDATRQLNELNDSTLRDIGLTKGDVEWAIRLPMSVNASVELGKIADQRRQRLYW